MLIRYSWTCTIMIKSYLTTQRLVLLANKRNTCINKHNNASAAINRIGLYRSFWGFSKKDDDNNNESKSEHSKSKLIDSKKGGIVPALGENSPTLNPLIILPKSKVPIFPGYLTTLTLKDKNTIDAIETNNNHGYIGVFQRRKNDVVVASDSLVGSETATDIITDRADIYDVGTFCQIHSVIPTELGTQLLLMGHRRISLTEITSFGPPAIATVKHWKRPPIGSYQSQEVKAFVNEVMAATRELIKANPLLQEQLQQWASRVDFSDPYRLADFATALTTAEGPELQKVLEASDPLDRLSLTLDLLAKEREIIKLQREISKQVEEKLSKQQREYFLREQLKNIKKELGMERDDKDDVLEKYRKKLQDLKDSTVQVNTETLTLINDELEKLQTLEKNSPEFNVTRSYLDWLLAVPWTKFSEDVLDIPNARSILDEDHYGLTEIKDRILEFIAVGKLKGTVAGKIICFIGPPGVGKTSIAKSIARALNKKFYRFSVGGLTDTAEIKGHRRTYIGAMPGKPILSLKSTGVLNPLILIDEIDKVGKSYNGDPASALLELLDPNQNNSFVDHYLDHPVDFSNVLFVCTANDESTIPGPLRDRMEIIRLSGYDIPEKVAIAKKYLVPKALQESGLLASDNNDNNTGVTPNDTTSKVHSTNYEITDEALKLMVKNYCRESGVRSLEKMIEKVTRKIAFKAVSGNSEETVDVTNGGDSNSFVITAENLEQFAGKPIFTKDTIYDSMDGTLPAGVVMGLAWNPLGGSPIFIETAAIPVSYSDRHGGGVRIVTGQLGDVMKESVNIAYTFARQFVSKIDAENKFFNSHQLHLHVPEGAVSKDGPSAGIAMTTSLISIAISKSIHPKVAMTGEISLTGKVLPVGGIKEKVLAARRAGANTVILPIANKRDYEELPDYVKENINIHFAVEYADVYKIVFPSQ